MPTYDYECDACGHEFELFQSISEPVQRKCPECGKLKLRRLFGTGAAVVFKGSGFYQTDYRSESYKKAAEKDKSSASGDKSTGDGAASKDGAKSDGAAKGEKKSSGESKSADVAKPKSKKHKGE
jgi:putative FmdB family regulatory protein